MTTSLPLLLVVLGLVLFVAGDVLWLMRNTFSKPMNVRVTGGLVASGVALIGLGLVVLVVTSD